MEDVLYLTEFTSYAVDKMFYIFHLTEMMMISKLLRILYVLVKIRNIKP